MTGHVRVRRLRLRDLDEIPSRGHGKPCPYFPLHSFISLPKIARRRVFQLENAPSFSLSSLLLDHYQTRIHVLVAAGIADVNGENVLAHFERV